MVSERALVPQITSPLPLERILSHFDSYSVAGLAKAFEQEDAENAEEIAHVTSDTDFVGA